MSCRTACCAFCFLAAVCGALIGYLARTGSISFRITGVVHGWNMVEKGQAMHRAALAYVVIGFVLMAWPTLSGTGIYKGVVRLCHRCTFALTRRVFAKESLALLGQRKGSDLDSEDEEELPDREDVRTSRAAISAL